MRRVRLYQTDAIVLRRHNFGEADRILTLYSREHGKLRAVAKGVRRPQSRLAGHVELFSLTHFQLALGRDLDVVTQAEAREPFRRVRADLERTCEAYYALELVDRLTPERLENRALFELLCALLHGLDAPRPSPLARSWFAVHALAALGYRPQLTTCVACAAPIVPGPNYFAPLAGGVLCPTCGPQEPAARAIPVDVLKVLRYLQRSPALGQVRLAVAPALRGAVESALRAYIEPLVERQLPTEAFLDRLRRDTRWQAAASDEPALAGGGR
jgi:DNA repair protein RecO (recombination protein O)